MATASAQRTLEEEKERNFPTATHHVEKCTELCPSVKMAAMTVQLPCNEQRQAQLDQVTQDLIQPHRGSLQGQGINHISGQPVPVPHHPHCKGSYKKLLH